MGVCILVKNQFAQQVYLEISSIQLRNFGNFTTYLLNYAIIKEKIHLMKKLIMHTTTR
jgi:hypothetical protein